MHTKPINEYLKSVGKKLSPSIKQRLFKEGKLQPICEFCKQGEVWGGYTLIHQIDHKDGNPTNNKIDNLRVLCPNCHSQTHNFAGRNRGNVFVVPDYLLREFTLSCGDIAIEGKHIRRIVFSGEIAKSFKKHLMAKGMLRK